MSRFLTAVTIKVAILGTLESCNLSPGSYPNAEIYEFDLTEKELIKIIETVKNENPNIDLNKSVVIPNGGLSNLVDERRDHWYSFYFYYPDKDQIVKTWTRSTLEGTANFAFVGTNQGLTLGNWIDPDEEQITEFEERILSKIKAEIEGSDQKNWTIVYGDKHVFKVETPKNWVRDTESAQKSGLVAFFYPSTFKNWNAVYAFAHGYGKDVGEGIDSFIENDLIKFGKKYPQLDHQEIPLNAEPPILQGRMLSFKNLTDRYTEEVVYLETETAIITIVFAASTEAIYDQHVSGFNEFVATFKFLGTNLDDFRKK